VWFLDAGPGAPYARRGQGTRAICVRFRCRLGASSKLVSKVVVHIGDAHSAEVSQRRRGADRALGQHALVAVDRLREEHVHAAGQVLGGLGQAQLALCGGAHRRLEAFLLGKLRHFDGAHAVLVKRARIVGGAAGAETILRHQLFVVWQPVQVHVWVFPGHRKVVVVGELKGAREGSRL